MSTITNFWFDMTYLILSLSAFLLFHFNVVFFPFLCMTNMSLHQHLQSLSICICWFLIHKQIIMNSSGWYCRKLVYIVPVTYLLVIWHLTWHKPKDLCLTILRHTAHHGGEDVIYMAVESCGRGSHLHKSTTRTRSG